MAEIGLSDEHRERLADGINARSMNAGNHSGKVSSEQCAEWRRRVRLHVRYSEIAADEDVSAATVGNHVRDKCSHEVDEPVPAYAREADQ